MEEHKNDNSNKVDVNITYELIPIIVNNKKKSIKKTRNEYMKNYMANSNNVICSCGGVFKKYSTYIHNKSMRHKKYIDKYPNMNISYREMIITQDIINE